MSDQSHKKRQRHLEFVENALNVCQADGMEYRPEDPFNVTGAVNEAARRLGLSPREVLAWIEQGAITPDTSLYDKQDPHGQFRRTLEILQIILESEEGERDAVEEEIASLSREELEARFCAAQKALTASERRAQKFERKAQAEASKARALEADYRKLSGKFQTTEAVYADIRRQFIRPLQKTPATPPRQRVRKQRLMPSAILSDVHTTETVTADEVRGIGAYDSDVMVMRMQQFAEGVIRVCDDHANAHATYEGFVLNILGDMVSGNIHMDSLISNRTRRITDPFGREVQYSASAFDAAYECADATIPLIDALKERFGVVNVVTACGNHGRDKPQVTYKGHVRDSFDYLTYFLIAKHFAKEPRVTIHLPASTDVTYDVYGWRFLAMHGDRMGVKGGDGFIGNIGPIMRGNKKVREFLSNYSILHDYMLLGHFHSYQTHRNLVVNGSLKGPDGYSTDNRYNPEPPTQALFMIHPERGILYHHPIICDHMYRNPKTDPIVPPPNPKKLFETILGFKNEKPQPPEKPRGGGNLIKLRV